MAPAIFKAVCHAVARANGGTVGEFDDRLSGRNYFKAALIIAHEPVLVVCNATRPLVAFAEADQGELKLAFVDDRTLGEAFGSISPFQPLDAEWLESSPTSDMLVSLSEAELVQATYWRKLGFSRIGDLVFNNWD